MAGTTTSSRRGRGATTQDVPSCLNDLTVEHNAAIVDLETLRTALAAANTLLNQARNHFDYRLSGNPGFAIDTNFDVKNANAVNYFNGGTAKTLSANTQFDTGTAATIATTKWGVALLSVTSSGTATVTWFTASGAGYATEAAAIAAITDPGATQTLLGYATVQAAGSTWTAGTDALTTGTGGTPATATNYYNTSNPNGLRLGAVVTTTTVDAAGDMTAAKIGDSSGVAVALSS